MLQNLEFLEGYFLDFKSWPLIRLKNMQVKQSMHIGCIELFSCNFAILTLGDYFYYEIYDLIVPYIT